MAPEDQVTVLVVSGSLREASHNRRLARLAASQPLDGVDFVEFDALAAVEPFDEDVEADGTPPGAAAWKAAVRDADALLVVTPEYNGSIPGQLKNAFDWASRADEAPYNRLPESPLYGMPVAVASASTGQFGAVWARDELLKVVRTQGGRAIGEPSVALAVAHEAFDDDGSLRHAPTHANLGELTQAAVTQARAVRAARARLAGGASAPA